MIRCIFTHFKIKAARNCYNLKLQKDEKFFNEAFLSFLKKNKVKKGKYF